MKVHFTFFTCVALVFSIQAQDFSKAKRKTQKLLRKELKKSDVHSAFLAVYSPSKKINWDFSVGEFQKGKAVTTANPFYTASIGKTFTATSIAVLYEQRKLNFSDRICKYLPDSIVNGLHVLDAIEYSSEITIAQLLQHTSGLPDYFEGETIDGSPNAMTLLVTETEKFWTPIEMVNLAKYKMKPNFIPGTSYHYTDTEYILLGLIIEKISGLPLHDFYEKNIFEPIEMKNTYMHLRSSPISKTENMSELYADEFEVWKVTSLSLDWAGGGLVSTATDLNKFQQSLNSHKIISEQTLKLMQQWTPETKGMYYGYGVRKISFKELFNPLPNLYMIGHTGSTASFMFYCPELDVYLSGTLNQLSQIKQSVTIPVKVLMYIKNEMKE
jgi:D-alanyl-D-alanine carboxypeptidase